MPAKKTTKPAAAKTIKPAKTMAAKTMAAKTMAATTKTKKAKADGQMSALDAAAKMLADASEPMNTKAMIEAMATKGLWTSPGGATPWATLYSAIAREINEKGADARFVKVERGQFAAKKQPEANMYTRPLTHDDYADEAESAERAEAWPQASALWIRAAEVCADVERRNRDLDAATKCDREVEIDKLLAGIANRELLVPTPDERKSDSLDFHDLSVWSLRRALRLAYRAGNDAET